MKKMMLIAAAALCSVAHAEEAKFETTLAAGMTLNRGNSENSQFNMSVINEGVKEGIGAIRSGAEFNYAESTSDGETDTTSKNFTLFSELQKEINPRDYYYGNAKYFYDGEADVDYRVTLGPGYGHYFVKSDITKLMVEVGPSYVWEKVEGVKADYMALRIGERFDRKLSDTSKLWQTAELLPQIDDIGNYLLNFEIGIEAKLSEKLNLRVVFQDKYNSEPGDESDKNDATFIAGVSMKL